MIDKLKRVGIALLAIIVLAGVGFMLLNLPKGQSGGSSGDGLLGNTFQFRYPSTKWSNPTSTNTRNHDEYFGVVPAGTLCKIVREKSSNLYKLPDETRVFCEFQDGTVAWVPTAAGQLAPVSGNTQSQSETASSTSSPVNNNVVLIIGLGMAVLGLLLYRRFSKKGENNTPDTNAPETAPASPTSALEQEIARLAELAEKANTNQGFYALALELGKLKAQLDQQHGPRLSDEEVERIAAAVRKQSSPEGREDLLEAALNRLTQEGG